MFTSKLDRWSYLAPLILRLGLGAVVVWFGASQLIDPASWLFYVPSWTQSLGLAAQTVIVLNGLLEVSLGSLMTLGVLTRFAALIFFCHMIIIVLELGLTAIGVRDIGLSAGLLALAFMKDDRYMLS